MSNAIIAGAFNALAPAGLDANDFRLFGATIRAGRRVRRGQHVHRSGDRFGCLFAVRRGFYKSYGESSDGRTYVTGFPMTGDLSGLDGFENGHHRRSLVALEDGEVCFIPYAALEDACARSMALQRHLHRVMSSELIREQQVIRVITTMTAQERVASFLIELSERFAARGYSRREFNLRMTRDEIASYLGLKLETISRMFTLLRDTGCIDVRTRSIKVLDLGALMDIAGESAINRPEVDTIAVKWAA
jgi:CRP/FNR family transcriptional regulator